MPHPKPNPLVKRRGIDKLVMGKSERSQRTKGQGPVNVIIHPAGTVVYGGAARNLRLTDPAVAEPAAILSQQIASDPNLALEMLQIAGIATKDGRLSKRFGG